MILLLLADQRHTSFSTNDRSIDRRAVCSSVGLNKDAREDDERALAAMVGAWCPRRRRLPEMTSMVMGLTDFCACDDESNFQVLWVLWVREPPINLNFLTHSTQKKMPKKSRPARDEPPLFPRGKMAKMATFRLTACCEPSSVVSPLFFSLYPNLSNHARVHLDPFGPGRYPDR